MTQLEAAKRGVTTPEMEQVAREEEVSVDLLRELIAQGSVIITKNKVHSHVRPVGIGKGLTT